jgi:tetrapyrrole methylase family protein / MazG family protein
MADSQSKFKKLLYVTGKLRSDKGCPWDKKQTPKSLKKYLLSEVYELLEAIDQENDEFIKEELGDLLFQIILLSQYHKEKKLFSIDDILDEITLKMIRRHPHVFDKDEFNNLTGQSNQSASKTSRPEPSWYNNQKDPENLTRQWDDIKKVEKREKKIKEKNIFSSIPDILPALLKTSQITERAARTGFTWIDPEDALKKLDEEVAELKQAISEKTPQAIKEELGDVLFVTANIGRMMDIDPEDSLRQTINKFIRRFLRLENELKKQGKKIADCELDFLVKSWNQLKNINQKNP